MGLMQQLRQRPNVLDAMLVGNIFFHKSVPTAYLLTYLINESKVV